MTTTDEEVSRRTAPPASPWMTPKEAGVYSRYHKDTLLKACREYELSQGEAGLKNDQPKPNACRRIHVDDLERWMAGKAPAKGTRRYRAA